MEKKANTDTDSQFGAALAACRSIFAAKLNDYGASWRIMRPASITDQILSRPNAYARLRQREWQ